MTTAIFLILFFALFVAVLNWLPVATATNSAFLTSIATMVGYVKSWDFLFPITELFICVGIVVGFEVIVWGWNVMTWVLKKVRGATQ